MEKQDYQIEFEDFVKEYNRSQVDAGQIGELIVRMAMYFAQYNMVAVTCEKQVSRKAVEIIKSSDEETGKALSVAKANLLIDATEEASAFRLAKAHITSIEQFINSAKYLQRGVTNEMNYSGV